MMKTTSAILMTATIIKFVVSTVPIRGLKAAPNLPNNPKANIYKPKAKSCFASVCHDFFVRRPGVVIFNDFIQDPGVAAESSRGKERIIGRKNLHQTVAGARVAVLCGEHVLIMAGKQVQSRKLIAGNQPLNLIQNRHWVKGA